MAIIATTRTEINLKSSNIKRRNGETAKRQPMPMCGVDGNDDDDMGKQEHKR